MWRNSYWEHIYISIIRDMLLGLYHLQLQLNDITLGYWNHYSHEYYLIMRRVSVKLTCQWKREGLSLESSTIIQNAVPQLWSCISQAQVSLGRTLSVDLRSNTPWEHLSFFTHYRSFQHTVGKVYLFSYCLIWFAVHQQNELLININYICFEWSEGDLYD